VRISLRIAETLNNAQARFRRLPRRFAPRNDSIILIIVLSLLLAGCASNDSLPSNYKNFNADAVPNAVPKIEPISKYGNPNSYVVLGKRYYVLKSAECYDEKGIASWYGVKFHEKLTSNREPYNMYAMTAANKVLPLPTYVRVRNLQNGKTIIVRVNDRGPFHENRIIDLSFVAAKKLDVIATGTALVEVTAINPHDPNNESCGVKPVSGAQKTNLYLQLGAFSQQRNAEQLALRVKKLITQPTQVIEVTVDDKTLYKVQIGPLKDVATVDNLSNELNVDGLGQAFAVVR